MFRRIVLFVLLIVSFAVTINPAAAQDEPPFPNLGPCAAGAFSTEEDFMADAGVIPDGIPYISDGDLLSINGAVCARNRELFRKFKARFDVGLDAVDILNFEKGIIAISSELDHFKGRFTDGDLLLTNGVIIPNRALTEAIPIRQNIGLDGVQFIGTQESIDRFVKTVTKKIGVPGYWDNSRLRLLLARFEMDIWYSVEGTWTIPGDPITFILDGDVLSARNGTIVAAQQNLLDAPVPAGIPQQGVDFGLDGLAASRAGVPQSIHFSLEITHRGDPLLTDGAVIQAGNNTVLFENEVLTAPFAPAAEFLGLDALYLPIGAGPDLPMPDAPEMREN